MEEGFPKIDSDFFCIVNRDEPALSAIVSSYLFKKGLYLPMFEFPSVTKENDAEKYEISNKDIDEHYITVTRAHKFNIRVKNILSRIGGCSCLVLVGLSESQKSYLSFLDKFNIFDIQNESDIEIYLKYTTSKTGVISCKPDEIYKGLALASQTDSILKIEYNAQKIQPNNSHKGLIVIENVHNTSAVIAVNYALSIGADVEIVPTLPINRLEIMVLIEDWRNGDANSFNDLSAAIYDGIQDINFTSYKYVTFFTVGAPYSLILKNIIPITHVNLQLSPDFFIFSNLHFENNEEIKSAVVFSPQEFTDEETDQVIRTLAENNYYVKQLLGKEATVYNIDNHVKEFPFNLLHICSHGGEVSGYSVVENFTDTAGISHTIEYDEVVSFAPSREEALVGVTSKQIFRKFNGYRWLSKELKNQNYPHYVFSDMMNEINKKEKKDRKRKDKISGSSAIVCHDFSYQGIFGLFSNSPAPIIFNNSCWSWGDISHSFISAGARSYIGTLWNVNNYIAKKTAESFYQQIFDKPILDSLQTALSNTQETEDEHIYILWGLHFTSIYKSDSIESSKKSAAKSLFNSLWYWQEKVLKTEDKFAQRSIYRTIRWSRNQLRRYFQDESIELFLKSIKKRGQ